MALSSSTASLYLLLLSSLLAVDAAPGNAVRHAYTDFEAEAQLSPPRRRLRCTCYTVHDPNSSEGPTWFCTEDSDEQCYRLSTGGLVLAQERLPLQDESEAESMEYCVCHLSVNDEASDFTCSHPHCYKRFAKKEGVVKANNWPNYKYECTESSVHETDPYCCRCVNNEWNCRSLKQHCNSSPYHCPEERQVLVEGDCCPRCLQEDTPVAQRWWNQLGLENAQMSEGVQKCECSVCKNIDQTTGDVHLKMSRTHPECQCDFYARYPYADLPECHA